jgi:hypothetical protein
MEPRKTAGPEGLIGVSTVPPDKFFREFCEEKGYEPLLGAVFDEQDWCMVAPDTSQIYKHLRLYDHPEPNPDSLLWNETTYWIKDWFSVNRFQRVPPLILQLFSLDSKLCPSEDNAFFSSLYEFASKKLNLSARPGPRYEIQGYRTKGECLRVIVRDACVKIGAILRNEHVEPSHAGVTGRGKRAKIQRVAENPDKAFGRLIRISSAEDILICAIFEAPWTDLVHFSADCAIGDSPFYRGGKREERYFYGSKPDAYGAGPDVIKMDANFPLYMTRFIFKMLFSHYGVGAIPRFRLFCLRVHTDCICEMPDGINVHVTTGLSTGGSFVTLIETIGTLACVRASATACLHEPLSGGQAHMKAREMIRQYLCLKGLGDDHWYTGQHPMWDATTFSKLPCNFEKASQLKLHDLTEKGSCGNGPRSYLFLSRRLCSGGEPHLVRPTMETLLIAKYPERHIKSLNWSYTRVCGLLLDNGMDAESNRLLSMYLDWCESKGAKFDSEPLGSFASDEALHWMASHNITRRLSQNEIHDLYHFEACTYQPLFL